MKTLRKLTSVLVLTLMLGLPAFSGETDTPPCTSTDPGETHTPPCSGTPTGDMGDPSTPSTAMAADDTFTEIATEVLESMLWIF
jgi:hypothetical protein